MNECNRFRKQVSLGHFDESLREVSLSNQNHIASCPDCREWISQLGKIEEQLNPDREIPAIEPEVLRRMKRSVMVAIDATPIRAGFLRSFLLSTKLIAFSSAAALLILIIAFRIAPIRHGSDHDSERAIAAATLLVEETDSLDTADPEVLSQALWIQIDTALMPFIEEEIETSDSTGLSDSMLETARSFQEDDWNALRRYLS